MDYARLALGLLPLVAVTNVTANTPPMLESVVVTATGYEQPGVNLNSAWSVVNAEEIERTAHLHINEVVHRVPGTWISRGNGQEHLTAIRSPVLTGAGGCGSFFMAQDGIALRASGFCNVNQLFDATSELAGRLEVLRGPGSALYGSNAMHGVINVITPRVGADGDGSVRLEAGPHDYQRLRLEQNWRQTGSAIRFSAMGSSDGGYKDDSGYGQQKLNIAHEYIGAEFQVDTVLAATNLNQETSGFVSGDDAYKDSALKKINPNPEAYRDARSWRWHSSIRHALDENSDISVTPFARVNEMQFLQHFLPWKSIEDNSQRSAGIKARVHSNWDNTTLTYGGDAVLTRADLQEFQPEPFRPAQPQGQHYDYEVDAREAAFYAQLNRSLSDSWDLDIGGRYQYSSYDYDNTLPEGSACEDITITCRFFRPADTRDSFADWSGNIGLGYQYHYNHRAFVRAARGYRAPQATELYRLQQGQQFAALDSERAESIEIGFRGGFDQLQYDLQLWAMKKDDVIFQNSDRQNISGAKTTHLGLDMSIGFDISSTLSLSGTYSHARHQYQNNSKLLGSRLELKGNDMDTAPRHTASARLRWQPNQQWDMEMEWIHMGKYYTDPDNNHEYPGHDLVNVRAYYQLSEKLAVGLRTTNVLNADYAERADFGFGQERYFVGEPRSAFFDLRYQWSGG